MTMDNQVTEFHIAMGLPVDGKWTEGLLKLRFKLLQEEYEEMGEELTTCLVAVTNDMPIDIDAKARLLKELCDCLYVIFGTAVALGLPIKEAFDMVHMSNMSKLGDNGKPIYNNEGKVLKGPNYQPANLLSLFKKVKVSDNV